jgi:hypothetical protein
MSRLKEREGKTPFGEIKTDSTLNR